MNLLDENTPWPEVWALNPGTGFREPKPKPLIDIVMTGVHEMERETGKKPECLLVPMARKVEFLKMFNEAIGMTDRNPSHGASQFVGLRVLWCVDGAMRLS